MTGKACAECGSAMQGRTDKKYCSDQCRFLHNNRKRSSDKGELLLLKINASLRRNRSILRQASPEGKTTVSREYLDLNGFDFRYHTHLYRTQKGNTYHFCYDYGYLLLPDNKVLIVNHQPYMDSRSQPYS